jgi:hypothetical protein
MQYLPISFNDTIISQLPVYRGLSIDWQLMGAKEIVAEIDLPGVLACPIGCYIMYRGRKYTVNTVPGVTAGNTYEYKFTITFESDQYRLYDKKLKHLKNKTFQYYGDLNDFAQLIVDNINEIDSGWSVGVCDVVPEKTINFDGHTCRTALDTIAEAFEVEWNEDGKTLTFVKQVGNVTAHVFERGMGKGLYTLGYQYQEDKNIVTQAFGYGSSRNLPEGYRDGATQLMFDGFYLENNVDLYRVKEGDYVNEDIYPKVDGLVSAVSAFDSDAGSFTITDSTLDFNLKDYFSSETPKISFLTGELQGQEFEILDYNNTTKTIKIKVFVDGSSNKLPNAVFQAAIGDTYTLFDMFLPTERVEAAEEALRVATQEWLDENSIPRVLYNLEMDPLYARDNGIMLEPGDKVTVIDTALGINSLIRVTAVNYPINFPDVITPDTKINVQIANFIPYTKVERIIADGIDNQHEIKIVNRTNAEKARLNTLNLRLLQGRIFNPDGTLFDGPESVVAGMAAFGFDSQNFNLNDVTINPNAGADENSMVISAGTLIHRIYKIDGLGYEWAITLNSWSGLDPLKFYYVYAKCNKAALTGTWEMSETPVSVNDIPGYYAFNVGILYEVNADGYRDFEFTKGMTYIVGDTITTGRIKDITGQNYFDLNSSQFNIGDATTGLDWNVTTPATLTIRGALASKVIQVGSDGVINAGISGVTDDGDSSIRFWAGDIDKNIAGFKVKDNGEVFATRLQLGYGTAEGSNSGWNVTSSGIISDPRDGATENFALIRGSSLNKEFSFGTELIPGTTGGTNSLVGRIENKRAETDPLIPTTNTGVSVEVSGANHNNAIDLISGNLKIQTGNIEIGGQLGFSGTFEYERNGHVWMFTFTNGILTFQELIS